MKLFLPTIGSAGDVFPLLGLGMTLRERGHEVVVGANEFYEGFVRDCGLDFIQVGDRAAGEQLLNDPLLWDQFRGLATIINHALLPATPVLMDAIRRFDPAEVVIGASPLGLAARLAQEKWGYRVATLLVQPALLRSVHDTPINGVELPRWLPGPLKRLFYFNVDRFVIAPHLNGPLNEMRRALDLRPIRRPFGEWLMSPTRVIGLYPDWFAPRQPDWPDALATTGFMLYDAGQETPLPDGLQRFLEGGDAPLLFTAGSAMRHADRFFAAAVDAAQRLGRRAILVAHDRAQMPDRLPESVLYVDYVPFNRLMPHLALIAHHGGIGTLAQALAAGVPQLILPMTHDQPDNARRIRRLGVGNRLAPRHATGPRIAAQIDALLGDKDVARRCQRLAQRIDPQRARVATARLLEAMV
ncbi:MAG: glycosyltransferase [Anaerolineales bacterium]|nr:glycosyltransferase [Anaerolineales bacterium]MCB9129066.1 glycosyltransferase [Ardenticatenales bacterium]